MRTSRNPRLDIADVFSIRQNSVAADVQMIGATLRHIGRVVMVLDPWDRPICLTRVWW